MMSQRRQLYVHFGSLIDEMMDIECKDSFAFKVDAVDDGKRMWHVDHQLTFIERMGCFEKMLSR